MPFYPHSHFSIANRRPRRGSLFRDQEYHFILPLAIAILALLADGYKAHANDKTLLNQRVEMIISIIGQYRSELAIGPEVQFSLVPWNKRLVSVEQCKDKRGTYVILMEEDFLDSLDDSELCAAIAHELGHVWIFTHHPYLQTERLANQIARKVVPKENLEKVYAKVWKNLGIKEDIEKFVGEDD